jgi:Putative adhesin
MTDQETYDPRLDTPSSASVAAQPAGPLPNEPYYQLPSQSRHPSRARGLGVALVLVGLVLLAFQLFGHGLDFGGAGSITLVDKDYQGNRIELSVAASDVEIRPGSGNSIHIEAIQRGGSDGDYQVDVVPSGNTLRVTESSRSFFCFFCSRSVRYRITVPNSAQADIHTASGEIDVEGLSGAVSLASSSGDVRAGDLTGGLKVSTTSGDVQLSDIAGKLDVGSISGDVKLENGKIDGATVNTTSGEVDLDGVAGALKLTSVSGDLRVRAARDGQLDFSTTSGEIKYEGSLASKSANSLNSISGDVNLQLPDASGFRLDASTVSGDLSSEFELRDGQQARRNLSGTAGDASATLTIGTTSGDISIERQ